MTEFVAELRHHCRNPKCQSKLKTPVTSPREAFCTRGCHTGFYRSRCRVCEESYERKNERQQVCFRRKCRAAFKLDKAHFLGSWGKSPSSSIHPLKKAAKPGVRRGTQRAATWRHYARVPDGPDCRWQGGRYERLEKLDCAALQAHFDDLDRAAIDHCALCARTDDLVDRRLGKRWLVICRDCLARDDDAPPGLAGLIDCLIPRDLSIPAFLKRAA